MAEQDPGTFDHFLTEVKAIEKKDAVLTNKQQIDRLLRPGSTYFNLNPYEVLLVDPDSPAEQIRKAYRKLSILVHPDKNEDDKERAQKAFDAVHTAYKMFDSEDQMEYCKGVVEEARANIEERMKEKRKVAKKNGKDKIEEDDPEKYKEVFGKALTKLFADYHIRKKQLEERELNERKRQREQEEEEANKVKREKEWKHEWESTRNNRVDSWRSFQQKGSKKEKHTGLKPPKLKTEKRPE
eukprot:Em0023g577a